MQAWRQPMRPSISCRASSGSSRPCRPPSGGARRAGVSQPTVTRFCRSVGCASFHDFKLGLATTLTVAAAYLRSDRVFNDDIGQLAQTVMMRAAATVRETLDQLDTIAVSAAIAAFSAARRIDIYGQGGGSAALMDDAKLRLFRLGIR